MWRSKLKLAALLCVVLAGCATSETFDSTGLPTDAGDGAFSTGGAGGSTGVGGVAGACSAGQKACGGICLAPTPGIGCSMTQCTPCPAVPAHSTATCSGEQCSFQCNAGYTLSGNSCVASGAGGSSGAGAGSGGSGGGCAAPCNPTETTSQLVCLTYCTVVSGKPGLCAPIVDCCVC